MSRSSPARRHARICELGPTEHFNLVNRLRLDADEAEVEEINRIIKAGDLEAACALLQRRRLVSLRVSIPTGFGFHRSKLARSDEPAA